MTRKILTTEKIAAPVGPFSPALHAGEYVYLSEQVAQDPATGRLIATRGARVGGGMEDGRRHPHFVASSPSAC
jgi:enamine deaminase RidA (YjgF/YER057c/UK114 family)